MDQQIVIDMKNSQITDLNWEKNYYMKKAANFEKDLIAEEEKVDQLTQQLNQFQGKIFFFDSNFYRK